MSIECACRRRTGRGFAQMGESRVFPLSSSDRINTPLKRFMRLRTIFGELAAAAGPARRGTAAPRGSAEGS